MKKMCKVILAAAAVVALAVPAMAAEKLVVMGTDGITPKFSVSDTGKISLPTTAFTGSNVVFQNAASVNNMASMAAAPDGALANQGVSLQVIPRGTGFNANIKTQVSVFATDLNADPVNYSSLVLRAGGVRYSIGSVNGGTGAVLPIAFQTSNLDRLIIAADGKIGIGITPTHLFEVAAGTIAISPTTTTSAPASGAAGALPATPSGYMTITIGGVDRQVAFY